MATRAFSIEDGNLATKSILTTQNVRIRILTCLLPKKQQEKYLKKQMQLQ